MNLIETRFLARTAVVMLLVGLPVAGLSGCQSIKPYEKEYLLNPLMDDGATARLDHQIMGNAKGRFERLTRGAGGTSGSSCPTCGG